jgi:hypothetical protein
MRRAAAFATATVACHLLVGCSLLLPTASPVPIPENASPATWVLDPDQPRPGPDATSFTAAVTEQGCSSGRDIRGKLLPPVIQYLEFQVTVSLYLEPLPNPDAQECPGNLPTPFVIELAQPLGDRRLVDGIGGVQEENQ